jgi:hypothetical protein
MRPPEPRDSARSSRFLAERLVTLCEVVALGHGARNLDFAAGMVKQMP